MYKVEERYIVVQKNSGQTIKTKWRSYTYWTVYKTIQRAIKGKEDIIKAFPTFSESNLSKVYTEHRIVHYRKGMYD